MQGPILARASESAGAFREATLRFVNDPRIFSEICVDCWNEWLRGFSIKVINELRLDLSTEQGQAEYDRIMREFFGIE